ncbi:MAG: tetratricopeptide repeat protein [Proteobacteria bacterium]|nr:tetratricopeptide repeat protein [Pseudomonadota bacterium]
MDRYGWRTSVGAVVAILLSACAGAPADKPVPRVASVPQPLQRLDIAPDRNETDRIANLLAGELALVESDPVRAARHYVAAAQASDDAGIAEMATHIAIASRQWELAQAALTRWQALHGDEVGVRQARAMLALHAGADDEAWRDLTWLARRPEGWQAVAQALLGAQDKNAAGRVFERVLRGENPPAENVARKVELGSEPLTWVVVGQLAMRLDRGDIASVLAQRAVDRFHTPETYAFAAQIRLDAGDKKGALGLYAEALRTVRAVSGKEAVAALRYAYAALLGDLGEYAQAAVALSQGPQDDRVMAARAAFLARGDAKANKTQIEALYKQALAEAEPRSALRLLLLGQLSELAGRKADALKWYAQVDEGDEEWLDAQQRTAILLYDAGRRDEAMSLLHRSETRLVDDAKSLGGVFLLEAELVGKNGHAQESLAIYDRGLRTLPEDARLLYARGLAYAAAERTDEAIRDFRRVLELKPDDADAMNALGYTLVDRTDKKTEALALIEKAFKLKPGEAAIIDSLGWAQYRLGNFPEAIEHLRTAYAKQPDPEIAAHLGEVLWVSGKQAEARRVWDEGRKKGGENKILLETIKRLAS